MIGASPRRRRLAPLGAAGLLLLSACLPNPQSVRERRESFDRSGLEGRLLFKELPPGAKPVGAVFGERIELVGVSVKPEAPRRGDKVEVTLYWRAKRVIDEDYQVFVHGDSIGGNARRIHGDHFPAEGKYPTDVWREGEIVADPFSFTISGDYGPDRLGIYTGMYLGNYRVPLTSGGSMPSDRENRSMPLEIAL